MGAHANDRANYPLSDITSHSSQPLEYSDRIVSAALTSSGSPVLPLNDQLQQPQSKPKASLGFAAKSLKVLKVTPDERDVPVRIFHEKSGQLYYIEADSVPTFRIDSAALPDPIQFYESVTDLGEKYGCVKLVIVQKNSNEPHSTSDLNFEHFWFKTRSQYLDEPNSLDAKILNFYSDLYNFFTNVKKVKTFPKVPTIEKRTVNLYRLKQCVHLRGGFDTVCQKKLWAQIGRELGYSGRIMSSLSTSLRSAYVKILLEFDIYGDSMPPSNHKIKNKNHVSELGLTPVTGPLTGDGESETLGKRGAPMTDEERHPSKRSKLEEFELSDDVYEMSGINRGFKRIKDIKISKNIDTHSNDNSDDSTIGTKPCITPLSGHDPSSWQYFFPTHDKDSYDNAISPVYNIKQYYDQSQMVKQELLKRLGLSKINSSLTQMTLSDFEKLFFQALEADLSDIEIDTAMNVSSVINSGRLCAQNLDNTKLENLLNPWKLANVPLSDDSLLRVLDFDMGNFTRTTYDVGMLLSVSAWSSTDNFMPLLDYQHIGGSKLWYVIAPDDREKFEDFLRFTADKKSAISEIQGSGPGASSAPGFKDSELFNCYVENSMSKESGDQNTDGLDKYEGFLFPKLTVKNLPSEYQVKPEVLELAGIKTYKIIQEPGTYIFKFPKAYSTTIGNDFYVSESAYFAPRSWLKYVQEGSKWLAENQKLVSLHSLQFLIMILLYFDDTISKSLLIGMIVPRLENELTDRIHLKNIFPDLESVEDKFDFISDYTLSSTGLFKIVLTLGENSFNMTISEFLNMLEPMEESNNWKIFGKPLKTFKIVLHSYYSIELLNTLLDGDVAKAQQLLKQYFNSPVTVEDELNIVVAEQYPDRRMPLEVLEEIFQKGKKDDDYSTLVSTVINDSNLLRAECKYMLDMIIIPSMSSDYEQKKPDLGQLEGKWLIDLPVSPIAFSMHDLKILRTKLLKLPVTFTEMDSILDLYNEAAQFQQVAEHSLSTNNIKKIKLSYMKSFETPLDRACNERLVKAICRHHWLDTYYELFVSVDPPKETIPKSVPFLYKMFNYGLKFCYQEDIYKLERLHKKLVLIQDVFKRIRKIVKNIRAGSNILIADITNILENIQKENIPVSRSITKTFDRIMTAVEDAKVEKNPLWKNLSVNKQYIDAIDRLLRQNSVKAFSLCGRFNGSKDDQRLCISDVNEESVVHHQVKECKSWTTELNKCLKRQKITNILTLVTACLDLDFDCFTKRGSLAEKDAKYCFCRKGESGTMIECDICKEWYHTNCIGQKGSKSTATTNSVFVCSLCNINSNTVMSKRNGVNYGDLKRSVISSLSLEIIPDRRVLQTLFKLFEICLTFKNQMEAEIYENGRINTAVPMDKVKFYLRKAEGSKIEFVDLVGPLKRYCHNVDEAKFAEYRMKEITVVTNQEHL
ncbi:Ecm5p KNAG_0F01780 [Huiozyma naganishii CBS 8797]|uniref:PHD-type domain-containing protein n=1 Tax=Huiozyma naganishii (strain ATCC MYA-139 / BCRC 22969 / CBS 8797 / KCTC 17520 / NBRC 10181 / NCYC 3082 / Yp74L-3) TaxID=1071383 RepID=J7S8C4_HUIN7|nr:hypothetical protein KNAG_0F01780 [Kazachstania naganishii CBS 8797]CCK70846.1 hypothetical protein KNAG_0F01780 [Kazachstania naganishii CBS 8797]